MLPHRLQTALFAALLPFWSQAESRAESIWARGTQENSLLFFDTNARHAGDLVTVIISQQTGVDSREDRGMKKSSKSGGLFDFNAEADGGFGEQAAAAAFDLATGSNREFGGGSNYRSAQGFSDRVTATVVEVLPNGNMLIRAQRDEMIAGETRSLVLTGMVRSVDLSPQNTIDSRFIADLNISYAGNGPGQRFTRQGWLSRMTNRVWPF